MTINMQSVVRVIIAVVVVVAVVALVLTWSMWPILHMRRDGWKLETRMRGLHYALVLHAMNNNGGYPPDLTALTNVIDDPQLYVAPKSGDDAGDMADVMAWTSWVYVPGARMVPPSADAVASNAWHEAASRRVILAYLPRTKRSPYGLLLYQDGHLLCGTAQELTRALNRTFRAALPLPAQE